MNKADYISAIAEKTGHTKTVIEDIITAQGLVVGQVLKAGREVVVPKIGKLSPKKRPARQGRNPSTGAVIQIAASTKVGFKPLKELNDAVA